jgi:hypothetical protein
MTCHYRKRFVPDSTIRARMDARDRRFDAEQRAKFPHLFPEDAPTEGPLVIRYVDLVPAPHASGPVRNVGLQPAQTVPGCRVCLLGTGAIVELVDLICPTCGMDYRERGE